MSWHGKQRVSLRSSTLLSVVKSNLHLRPVLMLGSKFLFPNSSAKANSSIFENFHQIIFDRDETNKSIFSLAFSHRISVQSHLNLDLSSYTFGSSTFGQDEKTPRMLKKVRKFLKYSQAIFTIFQYSLIWWGAGRLSNEIADHLWMNRKWNPFEKESWMFMRPHLSDIEW